MSAFVFPTIAQIRAQIIATWQSYRPSADTAYGSDVWLASRINGPLVHRLHQSIQRAIDALHPGTTYGKYLDFWLYWVCGGSGRYLAAGSSGSSVARVTYTGAPGSTDGAQLYDAAGLLYEITEDCAGTGSPEDLSIEAIDTGASTNLESGSTLTFVSAPANVDSTVTLQGDLDGGRDRETDSEGRARLLARYRNPVLSGNIAHIAAIAEETLPGLVTAVVWPMRRNSPQGWGTYDCTVLQTKETGSARIPTSDQRAAVLTALEEAFPVTSSIRVLEVTAETATKIEVTIELGPNAPSSARCDWDAEAVKATVSLATSVAGVHTITASVNVCSPTITDGLQAGDRVIINNEEVVVDTVNVGADAKVFTLVTFPWSGAGVLSGSYITAGGGVIDDVNEAIRDYCDTVIPERGTYISGGETRDDQFRVKKIQKAALDASEHMLDVTVDDIDGAGATDLAPTASVGTSVYLLVYDEIVVWEDK